jgi:hypothetical protein
MSAESQDEIFSKAVAHWELALEQMRVLLDRDTFFRYLERAALMRLDESVFIIGVRNENARTFCESKLYRNIEMNLEVIVGRKVLTRYELLTAAEEVPVPSVALQLEPVP